MSSVSQQILDFLRENNSADAEQVAEAIGNDLKKTRDLLYFLKQSGRVERNDFGAYQVVEGAVAGNHTPAPPQGQKPEKKPAPKPRSAPVAKATTKATKPPARAPRIKETFALTPVTTPAVEVFVAKDGSCIVVDGNQVLARVPRLAVDAIRSL
jgi:hypothetical protein